MRLDCPKCGAKGDRLGSAFPSSPLEGLMFDRWACRNTRCRNIWWVSKTDRPVKHLSDETLRLLVENARQLEEGSGVVVDEDGQVVTE